MPPGSVRSPILSLSRVADCYTRRVDRRSIAYGALTLCALIAAQCLASEPTADRGTRTQWALRPVKRLVIPLAGESPAIRTPVDRFIVAALETKGLRLSPNADKAMLLRRATFDLHGLPPTPADQQAFEADNSPEAFARVVDRLLASPRYGEHWTRHWLDVIRFAESHGFEFDRLRENAWRYRDYIVDSFNSDKPYDRFVREQLAGDVLTPQSRDGIIATGFLVAGPWDEAGYTSASAVLKERIREDELEDMIAAVSQTFLALTVNCARCHDHKFDPIPQQDYYRIKAALQGVRHGERSALTTDEANDRETRVSALQEEIAALETRLTTLETKGRRLAMERRRAHLTPQESQPWSPASSTSSRSGSAPRARTPWGR